jgi:hypothetical protein
VGGGEALRVDAGLRVEPSAVVDDAAAWRVQPGLGAVEGRRRCAPRRSTNASRFEHVGRSCPVLR